MPSQEQGERVAVTVVLTKDEISAIRRPRVYFGQDQADRWEARRDSATRKLAKASESAALNQGAKNDAD